MVNDLVESLGRLRKADAWWRRLGFGATAMFVLAGMAVLPPSKPASAETQLVTPIPVGSLPEGVAVNPVTNLVYVANLGSNTVSVIDGETSKIAAKPIPVGTRPWGVAVNPATNRVYVTNLGSNTVTVIDAATNAVVGSAIPVGRDPEGIAVNPATNRVYVANTLDNTVTVIDGAANAVVGSPIPVGIAPDGVAVNPVTDRVYVANFTPDEVHGTVTVIDGATNAVMDRPIQVGRHPAGLDVNPAINRVYVADGLGQNVSEIDGAANKVIGNLFPIASGTRYVAVNPANGRIYVVGEQGRAVTVIEGVTNSVVGTPVTVQNAAEGIAVNPVTGRVYVATQDNATVDVIGVPFSIAPSTASPGKAVTATWSSLFAPHESDFVGFFDQKAPNTSPLTITFTRDGSGRAPDASQGSVDLKIPTDLVPGQTYEVRLVSGRSGGTMAQLIEVPPPGITDDTYDANSGIILTIPAAIGVLANDMPSDPSLLRVTVMTNPSHGTLALQTNGAFTYTADATFVGQDHFVYRVTNQFGISATGTVTLRVTAVPAGKDDTFTVVRDTILTVSAPGVLANDTDLDSPTLRAERKSNPTHGTLALQPNGAFTYTPSPGFTGTDTFTYLAADQTNFSPPATVTITVTAPAAPTSDCSPRPPVKVTQTVSAGKLVAHVQVSPLNGQQPNMLRGLRFGTLQNAKVSLNGQPMASSQMVTPPAGTAAVDVTVERATPGQATTVPLTVVDGCGEWQTFVGGGPGTGF
jgi:YVTN family beta-propeller protein/VCBS repeat-containing protein